MSVILFSIFILLLSGSNASKCVSKPNSVLECVKVKTLSEILPEIPRNIKTLLVTNRKRGSFLIDTVEEDNTNLDSIEQLDLEKAGVLTVTENAFHQFSSLKHLIISHNELSAIPPNWFSVDNTIENLDISSNNLVEITESVKKLNKLKYANFSSNAITSVDMSAFSAFRSLVTLDLSRNSIESLELPSLPQLLVLDLSANSFGEVPDKSFSHARSLEVLDLSKNAIATLKAGVFSSLLSIKSINLSENDISSISDGVFQGFDVVALNDLNFHRNRIDVISKNAFRDLRLLKTLDLSNNLLRELNSETFMGLMSLRELNIAKNQILNIQSNSFGSMPAIVNLNLSGNILMNFNSDLMGQLLDKLNVLDLSENQLMHIQPHSLRAAINLDTLLANSNHLNAIDPFVTYNLTKLRKLNLGHNDIEDIDPTLFDNLRFITEINISYNKLTFLPLFKGTYNRLRALYVEGNPWQCPCYNSIMTEIIGPRKLKYGRNDGSYPACIVTPVDACVRNITLVREYGVVATFFNLITPKSNKP